MLYRLTFALNEEEIVTTEMASDKEDLLGQRKMHLSGLSKNMALRLLLI